MLKSVTYSKNEISYMANQTETQKQSDEKSRILPNNARTRLRQNSQKVSSALIDYPLKGLKGDVNSNFYEFLAMGIIPYLAGSATLMFVFNAANKHLNLFPKDKAASYGRKMGLGVVLYGLMKGFSKHLVTKPVKHATGVDVEMPYENVTYTLPTGTGENANIEILHQQRKVFDSKEFFRKDLLNKEYYDKVTKRLGMGENLNDPVSETTPVIQNIVATTNTAKSISSYCWAAVGVGMAIQNSWNDFFGSFTNRKRFIPNKDAGFIKNLGGRILNTCKNTLKITGALIGSFFKSFGQMWKGNAGSSGLSKHAGKLLIMLASIATAGLTLNTIIRAKTMAKNNNKETIDRTKKTIVM